MAASVSQYRVISEVVVLIDVNPGLTSVPIPEHRIVLVRKCENTPTEGAGPRQQIDAAFNANRAFMCPNLMLRRDAGPVFLWRRDDVPDFWNRCPIERQCSPKGRLVQ